MIQQVGLGVGRVKRTLQAGIGRPLTVGFSLLVIAWLPKPSVYYICCLELSIRSCIIAVQSQLTIYYGHDAMGLDLQFAVLRYPSCACLRQNTRVRPYIEKAKCCIAKDCGSFGLSKPVVVFIVVGWKTSVP